MSAPTYTAQAVVLRKTKLGESDLILTLLARDGSQLRVVAKGARKPSSSFSSRLELYSEVDLLCARGRSLDIVKEARLVCGHEALRTSMEHAAAAACMAELLEHITQDNLAAPKLFDVTHVALSSLERVQTDRVALITAAHLLKALSLAGLRPSLHACVTCGNDVKVTPGNGQVRFSVAEGGIMCSFCATSVQTMPLPSDVIAWARIALGSTFADLEQVDTCMQAGVDLLHLCQQWCSFHIGCTLKSIRFLLTTALV